MSVLPPGITTVIFDVFETLIEDTAQQWLDSFQSIIDEQRLGVGVETFRQTWLDAGTEFREGRALANTAYVSYFRAWRKCFEQAFKTLSVTGDADAAIHRVFDDLRARTPYPEVKPVLGALKRQCRTAILSNADDTFLEPVLDRLGVKFEAVLTSEGAGTYKPQARLFQEMLDRLAVEPGEALYVGDRQLEDVHGPSQVGMRAVWINRTGEAVNPDLPKPEFQISNLRELPGIIRR